MASAFQADVETHCRFDSVYLLPMKELGARFKVLHVNEGHEGNNWIVLDVPPAQLDKLYKQIVIIKTFEDDPAPKDPNRVWCFTFDVEAEHPCTVDKEGNKTQKPSLLIDEAVTRP